MSVKANWHLESLDLSLAGDDPMQVGLQVDIGGRSVDELHAELWQLIEKEDRYAKYAGLECSRKWDPRHILMGGAQLSCYTCPHFTPYGLEDDSPDGRGGVCKIGREQEDLVSMLQALSLAEAPTLDAELIRHFEAELEMAAEVAFAALC